MSGFPLNQSIISQLCHSPTIESTPRFVKSNAGTLPVPVRVKHCYYQSKHSAWEVFESQKRRDGASGRERREREWDLKALCRIYKEWVNIAQGDKLTWFLVVSVYAISLCKLCTLSASIGTQEKLKIRGTTRIYSSGEQVYRSLSRQRSCETSVRLWAWPSIEQWLKERFRF